MWISINIALRYVVEKYTKWTPPFVEVPMPKPVPNMPWRQRMPMPEVRLPAGINPRVIPNADPNFQYKYMNNAVPNRENPRFWGVSPTNGPTSPFFPASRVADHDYSYVDHAAAAAKIQANQEEFMNELRNFKRPENWEKCGDYCHCDDVSTDETEEVHLCDDCRAEQEDSDDEPSVEFTPKRARSDSDMTRAQEFSRAFVNALDSRTRPPVPTRQAPTPTDAAPSSHYVDAPEIVETRQERVNYISDMRTHGIPRDATIMNEIRNKIQEQLGVDCTPRDVNAETPVDDVPEIIEIDEFAPAPIDENVQRFRRPRFHPLQQTPKKDN
jgi:hypothetical protein